MDIVGLVISVIMCLKPSYTEDNKWGSPNTDSGNVAPTPIRKT